MTKKILVLGCSFTAGSYECEVEGLNQPSWIAPDKCTNLKGWWYFVDYFKDKDVTIIPTPAQGYWSYYQILLFLNEKNKLHYNEIWIQETLEPRSILLNKKNIDHIMLLSVENIDNFIYMQISHGDQLLLDPWNAKKENLPYTLWSNSFFNDIVKMCTEKIDLLCEERNIKGYVWSMYEPIMDCNHFTRLPLKNVRQELYNNNLLTGEHTGCHQTEEGNKYIAKNINTVS